MKKHLRTAWRVTRGIVVGTAFVICLLAALKMCFFFYPFTALDTTCLRHGAPVYLDPEYDLENRFPVQASFNLGNDMFLAVYLPEEDEQAPVVQLTPRKGPPLWTIVAMAEDRAGTYADGTRMVNLIRFDQVQKLDDGVIGVFGGVDWVGGAAGTWWKIDKDGNLLEYWYDS